MDSGINGIDQAQAYVTVLTHGDNYLPGVEVLGQSLRESGTTRPMVALVTDDVSEEARDKLRTQGWQVRTVERINNPNPDKALMYPRFAEVFTKLRIWNLTEYNKLVYLDADTLVLKNVDELFERPGFAAAPDFFVPDQFSSGVMVVEPSEGIFERMLLSLEKTPTYDGGDQGFLNSFFDGWYAQPVAHRLPIAFNTLHFILQFLEAHAALAEEFLGRIKIIHYVLQKPWLSPVMYTGGARLWWERYLAIHPELDNPLRRKLHRTEDQIYALFVRAVAG